jgi:hypothetical protein
MHTHKYTQVNVNAAPPAREPSIEIQVAFARPLLYTRVWHTNKDTNKDASTHTHIQRGTNLQELADAHRHAHTHTHTHTGADR